MRFRALFGGPLVPVALSLNLAYSFREVASFPWVGVVPRTLTRGRFVNFQRSRVPLQPCWSCRAVVTGGMCRASSIQICECRETMVEGVGWPVGKGGIHRHHAW